MLSHLAANAGSSVSSEVLQSVATATTGFVGSDLEALCAEARKSAIVEVCTQRRWLIVGFVLG